MRIPDDPDVLRQQYLLQLYVPCAVLVPDGRILYIGASDGFQGTTADGVEISGKDPAQTEPVIWDDIGADAPYYFITDYMQSYLHDYNSGTYIEIEGEMPYDTNAQIMWDKEAEIEAETEAEIEAKSQTTMENDNGEYTCDLEYGEHKLHLTATLLNASEGQLEKGIGYLFGIREIAEKIPGFLPDIQ